MRLGIFGTGYAGLVTSVGLAQLGHTVTAIDKNPDIIARLADGVPTIHEPGLKELLTSNLDAGRLSFTTKAADAMGESQIVFVCVGTPPRADGRADLSQVEEVACTIAPMLDGYKLIVEKSTVPARTAYWIDSTIRRLAGPEREFDIASNPEFLREGTAVRDFLHPDRIVIGADSGRARSLLLDLYQSSFSCPIIVTSVTTAELIKQAANAFLATKISFINMVPDVCEKLDVYAPAGVRNFERLDPPNDRLPYVASVYDAAGEADALVILTDWDDYRSLDFKRIRNAMHTPIVVDGRNLFEPPLMQAAGFEYYSLGRGDATLHQKPFRERV